MQIRSQLGASVQLQNVEQEGKKLVGKAIVYGSLSRNLGGFVERFAPGSVSDSVSKGLVVALINHDTSQPVGNQQNGTLRFFDSKTDLGCEIAMPDTSYARDAVAMMNRGDKAGGDATGMSFGFSPTDVAWSKENGQNVAEVRKADLGEVSVLIGVPPAYAATSIALRSFNGSDAELADTYGIDMDELASVFLSIKRGLALSDKEQSTLEQARSLFKQIRRPLMDSASERAARLFLD